METEPKSKNKILRTNGESVAPGRKSAAKINKTGTVRLEADEPQMKEDSATPVQTGVTNEERHQLIAEAAYFRAERRNFAPGNELEDWLKAEAEIEKKIPKAGRNRPPGNA